MAQQKLFYEDEFEALAMTISNSQRTFKEVAAHLFPESKPESGYARLKACLNPEKDERLTFGQIIAMCKFCERFDALMYMCDETLHARPDRKAPEDEQVRLAGAITEAATTLQRAMAQLQRLQGGAVMDAPARIIDQILTTDAARAVFVTPSGVVRSLNLTGAHCRSAQQDPTRMARLAGVYNHHASAEMIEGDINATLVEGMSRALEGRANG
ncbi:MAG TPA: hypothetical protein PK620_06440 [Denitromonas sp.]|nr:hypothetical protein [Zoogloeaceae bacterium]HQU89223.1 hypothetical protein [Denitromonas sp.]HQV14535.1 hypothetical protein [Denitromonas sp.]